MTYGLIHHHHDKFTITRIRIVYNMNGLWGLSRALQTTPLRSNQV